MPATQPCVRCGAPTGADALWGQCDKCLFEQAQTPAFGRSASSESNRMFGEYELGRQLGRGGMGVVYEAVQTRLRRTVALKMILEAQHASPQARRRFNIEAEAIAKLDHPYIVPIYEVGEHEGQPFLSMKLIHGETLRQKITSGALGLKSTETNFSRAESRARAISIARLMIDVARAVDHAHQHGVLHRDLKPANILVDQEGHPHLTDFGLAKIFEPGLEDGSVRSLTESEAMGTPRYMSPEQAAGQRASTASDTYSLGAVFYELLSGVPPFKAGTVLETLRMIAEQPPRRPRAENPNIDTDLETVCLKCLEKNPSARYSSTSELADDLERWLRREPIRARPAGVALRVIRWAQRNRLGATLILSLCAGLAGALVLWDLADRKQDRLDLILAINLHAFNQQVETLWQNPEMDYVLIESPRLAEMANARLRLPSPDAVTLTLATVISQDPNGQALGYAPILGLIEERMEALLGYQVLIDLRLYKYSREGTHSPVARGEVDFQRLGPLRYIQARENQPNLQLLVRETPDKAGVIFARKDKHITNLAQTARHRLALADTNSTISFLSQVYLARAGLTARDFSRVAHLDASMALSTLAPEFPTTPNVVEQDIYPHKEVLRRVLLDEFDVGEASRTHFEQHKHRNEGLVELQSFDVPPDVFVAKAGLDARMVEAIRHALCSLQSRHERKLLRRLKLGLDGYRPAKDADFGELRSVLTNEVRRFQSPDRP